MKIALLLAFTLCVVVASSPPPGVERHGDLGEGRRESNDFWQKWLTTEDGNLKKAVGNEGRVRHRLGNDFWQKIQHLLLAGKRPSDEFMYLLMSPKDWLLENVILPIKYGHTTWAKGNKDKESRRTQKVQLVSSNI
jgi:hypothetical protein